MKLFGQANISFVIISLFTATRPSAPFQPIQGMFNLIPFLILHRLELPSEQPAQ